MNELFATIGPLALWLPALFMIGFANLVVALLNRPLGRSRWAVFAFVAVSPATIPDPSEYTPVYWGILTTLVTTMAVITAGRLPDLDHSVRAQKRGRGELFLWMSLPMARFIPRERAARSANRARAPRLLLSAALKKLAWEPFAYITTIVAGETMPWPVRSAFLILYFVLNLTAAGDMAAALCRLLGADVDPPFDAPLLSSSPRDFWSRRWNKFISRFALKHVALPVGRRFPTVGVMLGVFATSGAFHEYFAWGVGGDGARYGYMTLFFLIQGVAVWLGSLRPAPTLPTPVKIGLTFIWMTLTAPLFFYAVQPALTAFGYPEAWTPF